jgi:putative transposase
MRLDNGPELTSQHLAKVVQGQGYRTALYPAGQTGSEHFHRALQSSSRTGVLDGWLLTSLDEVREIAHQWLQSYSQERPHDALGSLPPAVFREKLLAGENSTSQLST